MTPQHQQNPKYNEELNGSKKNLKTFRLKKHHVQDTQLEGKTKKSKSQLIQIKIQAGSIIN